MKRGWGLKFGPMQVQEMASRHEAGAQFAVIAADFETSSDTVRKYIRAWRRFGTSYWTEYPEEIQR